MILSCVWLEFWWLDTSCGWLRPTADWSSSGWIGVTADSILRLTRVLAAGYDLRLIPTCGWSRFAVDSSSGGLTRLAADLYLNVSSKFKDLFYKIHHFYGLFSIAWFQLSLIQALPAASRTLKNPEEAVAAADSSCDGWFGSCDQSTTSRILTLMPPDSFCTLNMWCVARFGTICTILKMWKHIRKSVSSKSNTPRWVFSRFINSTNGTRSCNASHILFDEVDRGLGPEKEKHFIKYHLYLFLLKTATDDLN